MQQLRFLLGVRFSWVNSEAMWGVLQFYDKNFKQSKTS
jgi:hypothetical protein